VLSTGARVLRNAAGLAPLSPPKYEKLEHYATRQKHQSAGIGRVSLRELRAAAHVNRAHRVWALTGLGNPGPNPGCLTLFRQDGIERHKPGRPVDPLTYHPLNEAAAARGLIHFRNLSNLACRNRLRLFWQWVDRQRAQNERRCFHSFGDFNPALLQREQLQPSVRRGVHLS
jgi:hypothetical protein